MAAENEQNEGQGLGAPAALVEGLRRLDRQVIFVTRQMDETILSRPRVHLARTRELRKGHGRMVGVAEEELALAARTAAPQHAGRSEFGVAETEGRPGGRWWRPLALIGAVVGGLLAFILVIMSHSSAARAIRAMVTLGPIPAPFVLMAISFVLVAVWVGGRFKHPNSKLQHPGKLQASTSKRKRKNE